MAGSRVAPRVSVALGAALASLCLLALAVLRPAEAAFPGADGGVAFSYHRDGDREIYDAVSDESSDPRRPTNNLVHDFAPSYSPEGNRIAFSTDRDGDAEI